MLSKLCQIVQKQLKPILKTLCFAIFWLVEPVFALFFQIRNFAIQTQNCYPNSNTGPDLVPFRNDQVGNAVGSAGLPEMSWNLINLWRDVANRRQTL